MEMWGCFLMSGVKILHFLKDWWKSIPIHQNYTMALKHRDSFGKEKKIKIKLVLYYFDKTLSKVFLKNKLLMGFYVMKNNSNKL